MTKHSFRLIAFLLGTCLLLSACGQAAADPAEEENHAVTVEELDGAEPTREILTEDAAARLDIKTVSAQEADVNGTKGSIIPYASVIYDTTGATWVYLNTEPLTFVRHPVMVDSIKGDQAFLSEALPSGSSVVTVGVAELYGAESEFDEE